jgi:hypothetical protein
MCQTSFRIICCIFSIAGLSNAAVKAAINVASHAEYISNSQGIHLKNGGLRLTFPGSLP